MFSNKIVNIIFSILVAIGLWIFVVGEVNPLTTQKYTDVEVRFINTSVLADSGLAISDPGTVTVDVTLQGARSNMKNLSSDEIDVTADLSNLKKGVNYVELDVALPDDVKLVKTSESSIRVTVEDLVSEDKPVEIQYEGTVPEGEEPGAIVISPETVQVRGASSSVEEVVYLEAVVNVDEIVEDQQTLQCSITPVDKDGNEVSYLTLSQDEVQVDISMLQTKTVPLEVDVSGEVGDGYVLESSDMPDSLTIKGTQEQLDGIDSVTGSPIDISQYTESTEISIDVSLPEGVEIAWDSENPTLKLSISAIQSTTFSYASSDLELKNLSSGLTVELPTKGITLSAYASQTVLDGLSAEDCSVYLDLEGLDVGTHSVSIQVQTDLDGITFSTDPETIKITISEE